MKSLRQVCRSGDGGDKALLEPSDLKIYKSIGLEKGCRKMQPFLFSGCKKYPKPFLLLKRMNTDTNSNGEKQCWL